MALTVGEALLNSSFSTASTVGDVNLRVVLVGLLLGMDEGDLDGSPERLGATEGALDTDGAKDGDPEGLAEGWVDRVGASVGDRTKVGKFVSWSSKVGNDVNG